MSSSLRPLPFVIQVWMPRLCVEIFLCYFGWTSVLKALLCGYREASIIRKIFMEVYDETFEKMYSRLYFFSHNEKNFI